MSFRITTTHRIEEEKLSRMKTNQSTKSVKKPNESTNGNNINGTKDNHETK